MAAGQQDSVSSDVEGAAGETFGPSATLSTREQSLTTLNGASGGVNDGTTNGYNNNNNKQPQQQHGPASVSGHVVADSDSSIEFVGQIRGGGGGGGGSGGGRVAEEYKDLRRDGTGAPRVDSGGECLRGSLGHRMHLNNNNNNDNEKNINSSSGQYYANLASANNTTTTTKPVILITDSNLANHQHHFEQQQSPEEQDSDRDSSRYSSKSQPASSSQVGGAHKAAKPPDESRTSRESFNEREEEEEKFEIVDGIRYRIVAAVTKPPAPARKDGSNFRERRTNNDCDDANSDCGNHNDHKRNLAQDSIEDREQTSNDFFENKMKSQQQQQQQQDNNNKFIQTKFNSMRRKSSAFVSNLLSATFTTNNNQDSTMGIDKKRPQRRLSIYEMTKSPPPETSLEIYLNERRRSSTISSKQIQQQLEQQSTFETNYCQRQQYFKDLNQKLINQDKKLLNVVANRGQIHRHSVDIAQLPLHLAQAKAKSKLSTTTTTTPSASTLATNQANVLRSSSQRGKSRSKVLAGREQGSASKGRQVAGGGALAADGTRKQRNRIQQRRKGRRKKIIEQPNIRRQQDKSNLLLASNRSPLPKHGSSRAIDQAVVTGGSQTDDFEKRDSSQAAENYNDERRRKKKAEQDENDYYEENDVDDYYYDHDDDDDEEDDDDDDDHDGEEDDDFDDAEDDDYYYEGGEQEGEEDEHNSTVSNKLVAIRENKSFLAAEARGSIASRSSGKKSQIVIRKFQKLDESVLSSTPAPDVKIGQRVAYKEYYGNEFGTIRWIGRVPQICPDWTVGVEFDNAIGEGDGSLNGRRYFIAKDCFAKFLPLNSVALVDQHVGRPEPGTMISVMSAAVRPGQMISIQRVSTVHVQHCFLNAPHRRPGADILAVNTRLHCQCPNCGPCAHVIKPPRTQRLARTGKNATHMCQFSTYTCCGMESQEETMCTYEGNKVISLPPPTTSSTTGLPPIGNSWIDGSGYLTNLQAQQSKLMPEEYKLGAAPEDIGAPSLLKKGRHSNRTSGRGSGKHHRHHHKRHKSKQKQTTNSPVTQGVSLIQNSKKSDFDSEIFKHQPNYTNTTINSNTQTQMELIPYNPKPIETLNSDSSFVVAQQDKINPYTYEETNVGYQNNNVLHDNSQNEYTESSRGKIMYRDSIENRYLFPTDDPIDSTLEQDLENLSQARYGHCNNSRQNGNSSKNIFKSLRSLVSCLGEQSNNSEFDKRHSPDINSYNNRMTNTMQYSENYGTVANPDNKCTYEIKRELYTDHHKKKIIYSNCDFVDEKIKDSISNTSSYTPTNCWKQHNNQQNVVKKDNYSSSDCGFSSASQNSMNHVCPTSADNQVYSRIITRLINSTSIKEEDMLKLKDLIVEPRENCCLHNKTVLNNFEARNIDQIIADVIKNTYLNQDKNSDSTQKTNPTIWFQSNNTHYHVDEKFEKSCCNEQYDKIKDSFYVNNSCHGQKSTTSESTGESAILSSNDSFCDSIGGCDSIKKKDLDSNIKTETKNQDNNLPKAFELKLTLSISDKAKNEYSNGQSNTVTDNNNMEKTNKIVVKDIPNELINSKLDININPCLNNHLSNESQKENVDDKILSNY